MKRRIFSDMKYAAVFCFCLGAVLLHYPFIQIFNRSADLWSVPALLFFLLLFWMVAVLVLVCFARGLGRRLKEESGGDECEEEGQ